MSQTKLGIFANRCPHCKSIEFRSVGARNALEQAVSWLFQPYRCELCGHHFFLLRWHMPATA
jgi:transposase-like protein